MEKEKMKPEDVSKHIEAIIKATFSALNDINKTQKEGENKTPTGKVSRLIFPQYSTIHRGGETRYSEQELRFLFVEKFNQYCAFHNLPWFYSVETPTEHKYLLSKKGETLDVPEVDVDGAKSAMIDMAIHGQDLERIALIEFKANNPKDSCYTKDFLKLREEAQNKEDLQTFFVMYVESYDDDTIASLNEKIEMKKDGEDKKYKSSRTKFYCYSLSDERKKWIVSDGKRIDDVDNLPQ